MADLMAGCCIGSDFQHAVYEPCRAVRPTLDWRLGTSDEAYGTQLWVARIQGLEAHLRIIRDYLPEDADWLRNQVDAALKEAARYVEDYAPLRERDHA